MRFLLSLIMVLVVSHLHAALPGVPETPGSWVSVGNDSFGLPPGPDDNRTAEESGGFTAAGYVFVVDDSMLTAEGAATKSRTDEITATVGREVLTSPELAITLGVGGRVRGNLGGQTLQNRFHAYTRSGVQFDLPCEAYSLAPLAYGLAKGAVGYALYSVSGTATADGELSADVFVGVGVQAVYAGLREQLRYSHLSSPTISRVFDYENGLWVDVGVRFWHLELSNSFSVSHRQAVATVTYRF